MIGGGCASRTRGVFGNVNPGVDDTLNVVTIASTGNAADYGNLTPVKANCWINSLIRLVITAGG